MPCKSCINSYDLSSWYYRWIGYLENIWFLADFSVSKIIMDIRSKTSKYLSSIQFLAFQIYNRICYGNIPSFYFWCIGGRNWTFFSRISWELLFSPTCSTARILHMRDFLLLKTTVFLVLKSVSILLFLVCVWGGERCCRSNKSWIAWYCLGWFKIKTQNTELSSSP